MKTELSAHLTFPRICAGIFSVGGTCWAIAVGFAILVSLSSPKAAVVAMLYFLPGWIVYFGWLSITKGEKPVPLSYRWFWLLSGLVNLGYFVHEFRPWMWLIGSSKSLNVAGYWWLLTGFVSLICAVATKEEEAEQVGDGDAEEAV